MIIPKIEELKFKNTRVYIKNNYFEFYNFLIDKYPEDISFPEKLYWYYHNISTYPLCPICNKRLKFKTLYIGYPKTCSISCSRKTDEYKEKIKQTNLKRYGVKNPFESQEVKEKIKQTNLERYGSIYASQSQEVKEKIKQTNLERYGVTCTIHNPNIQQKVIKTNLKRYGVKNPFESQEVKEKIKQTNLERYGIENPQKLDIIKLKTKNTYKIQFLQKHPDIIDIKYNIGQDNAIYTCKCNNEHCHKCKEHIFNIDSLHYWVRKNNNIELCTKLLPVQSYHSNNTTIEIFIKNILDEYNIEYKTNVRDIIPPKELDIYIPSKKIAIECNGCYWHSNHFKSKSYHYDKYIECLNNNIQLLTIWEDQIINNKSLIKSLLLSKLGIYKERIGARKCIIKEIDNQTVKIFLNENHIQGFTNSSIKLGLFYNDELISLMTFSKRKSGIGNYKKNDNIWELTRFCNKCNYQIIGGASKLFNYFIKYYNYTQIISYASHDISNGNLYNKLGFQKINETKYSYWYINKNDYKRYHRLNFTKYKLIQKGYNPNLTESEIMNGLEYFRIYDSGQSKYLYTKKESL